MTRAGNGRDQHSSWCTREEPIGTGMLQHRSRVVQVGARRRIGDRGQVTVCLTSTGNGPVWLTVNAAHMTGVTAELDPDQAAVLSAGLADLVEQAR